MATPSKIADKLANAVDDVKDVFTPKSPTHPKKTGPLTALVFGTMQSGKSSLIKRLWSLQETPVPPVPDTLAIGDNVNACTSVPHIYQLALTPKQCLQPKASQDKRTLEELYRDEDAHPDPPDAVPLGESVQVTLIDTPGLDDNQGRDETIILDVLNLIESRPSLNGIIFVVNSTVPASDSFKRFFGYYFSIFEELRSRFIILHTRFDRTTTSEGARKARVAAFDQSLSHIIGQSKLNHVFIDSHWDPSFKRRARFCHAFALESVAELLLRLRSFKPLELTNILYTKTEKMKTIDNMLINLANGKKTGFVEAMKSYEIQSAGLAGDLAKLCAEKSDYDVVIDKIEVELKELDHTTEILVDSKSVNNPWKWFSGHEVTLTAQSEHAIIRAECTHWETNTHTDPVISMLNGKWQATCVLKSGWFNGVNGTLVVYARKNVINAQRIAVLKTDLAHSSGLRAKNMESTETLNRQFAAVAAELEKFSNYIASYTKVITALNGPKIPLNDVAVALKMYNDSKSTVEAKLDALVKLQ